MLRIEDTDAERNREEWVDGICDALSWLGITWDEGPFRQSERLSLYANAAEDLFNRQKAYYCTCTRDEIDARTTGIGRKPGYDGHCRDSNLGPSSGGALRFKVPTPGETRFVDLVRGEVVFDNQNLEDFILVKSNGAPLFVLANVVDDIDMGITHVIRAEEHLPNTPKSYMVFEALGGAIPQFGHVPVLVNEKRQKLSKRRDRVAVEDYRKQGFLAPAMLNYLALLGWSPKDDREFMTVEEMILQFDINNVGHSPSFFDEKKLLHFNGVYIRNLSEEDFFNYSLPYVQSMSWWIDTDLNRATLKSSLPLAKERIAILSEVPELVRPIFEEPLSFLPNVRENELLANPMADEILQRVKLGILGLGKYSHDEMEEMLRGLSVEFSIPLRKLQAPLRAATTGAKVGMPLFETLIHIGKEKTIARIDDAIRAIALSRS